jgi:hypothetical protein
LKLRPAAAGRIHSYVYQSPSGTQKLKSREAVSATIPSEVATARIPRSGIIACIAASGIDDLRMPWL